MKQFIITGIVAAFSIGSAMANQQQPSLKQQCIPGASASKKADANKTIKKEGETEVFLPQTTPAQPK